MGDRYFLTIECSCGHNDTDVYYAPTSGFLTWKCPKCGKIYDLEKYSGIDAESTARTQAGVEAIRQMRREGGQ